MSNKKFKIGDRVICINNTGKTHVLFLGQTYVVKKCIGDTRVIVSKNDGYLFFVKRFEFVEKAIIEFL
jgi:hypothetical protein